MEPEAYFHSLDEVECRSLLEGQQIGRVAWDTDEGTLVIPVNFTARNGFISFRTAENTRLAGLQEPTPVAFQTDDIDAETAHGWTVLVRGMSRPADSATGDSWREETSVGISISIDWIDGRVISAGGGTHD